MKIPTYQTSLPASVRFDRTLSAHAKLLYSEIKALCDQQGYCWASNHYLAKLYGVQKETVSVWLRQLRNRGWVRIQLDQAQGNLRKIYLIDSVTEATPSYDKSRAETGKTLRGLTNISPPSNDLIPPKPPSLLNRNFIDKKDRVGSSPLTILSTLTDEKICKNDSGKYAGLPEENFAAKMVAGTDDGRPNPTLPKTRKAVTFIPPTEAQVKAYMQQQTNLCPNAAIVQAQAERFVNYYQSNGWNVGRHPMQDWQAAARNWLLNRQKYETTPRTPASTSTGLRHEFTRNKDYGIAL